MTIKVAGLFQYPVKSCAGIFMESASLDAFGISGDRNFMIVNNQGKFLTQRTLPKLALIQPYLHFRTLYLDLNAPGMPQCRVTLHRGFEEMVQVWSYRDYGMDLGNDVARWLRKFLGIECRLIALHREHCRMADSGDVNIAFSDSFQHLLTSVSSLNAFNAALLARELAQVPMDRFRPNIVVEGSLDPWAEDRWKTVRIGTTIFYCKTICKRCLTITTDQQIGVHDPGQQPLVALKEIHGNGTALFGRNMNHELPQRGANLYVGEEVEILEID